MEEPKSTSEQSIESAQLEKLNLEIRALRERSKVLDSLVKFMPAFTIMIALAGFFFGIYQFHQGQQRDRHAAQIDQDIKLQNQIRDDLNQIVQFPTDNKTTLAKMSLLLDDVTRIQTISGRGSEQATKAENRKTSIILAGLMFQDASFSEQRNVDLALEILQHWPDYRIYLTENQKLLNDILANHLDALAELHKKAPHYISGLKYHDQSQTEYDEPRNCTDADQSHLRHFEDLVTSFSRHLQLVQDLSLKQSIIKSFQADTCNLTLTEQVFGLSFDPKEDPLLFEGCEKRRKK